MKCLRISWFLNGASADQPVGWAEKRTSDRSADRLDMPSRCHDLQVLISHLGLGDASLSLANGYVMTASHEVLRCSMKPSCPLCRAAALPLGRTTQRAALVMLSGCSGWGWSQVLAETVCCKQLLKASKAPATATLRTRGRMMKRSEQAHFILSVAIFSSLHPTVDHQ